MASKELVISQTRHETKVGILEDGQLVEVYFQRANEYSLAGSIHKGRVTRVLPGMQSAFVDLGLERDCFLYVSDFFEEHGDEFDKVTDDRGRGRDRDRDRDRDRGSRDRQERPPRVEAAPVSESVPEPRAEIDSEAEVMGAPAGEPVSPEAVAERTEGDGGVTQADAGDRGGRRRRSRRRRRGRGFPESKYAENGSAEEGGADSEPAEEEADERPETPLVAEPAPSFTLLPGESLAKYRRSAPAERRPPTVVTPEEREPERLLEEAAEEAAEEILDRVEQFEEQAEAAAAAAIEGTAPTPQEASLDIELPEEDANEEEEEIESVEDEADEDVVPADEPELDEDEEGSPYALEEDGSPVPEGLEEDAPVAGDDLLDEAVAENALFTEQMEQAGVAPVHPPQNLSASLRAQGGKYPHRLSRRQRRRGKGGQNGPAEEASEAAGIETVEVRQPAPERERERDRDRDRGVRTEPSDRARPPLPSIADLLKEGQEIIVQIAKEPLGQKGARITSHIALPGRYVVYMPTVDHLGVSRKISTDEERQRLKRILQRHREGIAGGYIMRTAGEGHSEEEIRADMEYLANLWLEIKAKAEKRRAPALLHHDVEVVGRLLRDQLSDGFKAVWVDNEDLYEQVLHALERMQPGLLSRVKLYTRQEPIFDAFGITQELEKALRPKVWLKSGGYIVINQTEALVAIDVNTGKYVGRSNRLEDTIVKTNMEAVKEIVRQLRLRDLGGIIVVDFIDMDERKNRQKVMQALEEAMRFDKAPFKILQFNDFGLVAITRKRVKQSLERTLCAPCPYCEGAGYVKSVGTVLADILTQAQKYAKVVDGKECVLRVHPEVAKTLKSTENHYLEELEETLHRPVLVVTDPQLHQEKFDLT